MNPLKEACVARMVARGTCDSGHPILGETDVYMPEGRNRGECRKCRTERSREAKRRAREQRKQHIQELASHLVLVLCKRRIHHIPAHTRCLECRAYTPAQKVVLSANGNNPFACRDGLHPMDITETTVCVSCREMAPVGETTYVDTVLMCGHTRLFKGGYAPRLDEHLFCERCEKNRRVVNTRYNKQQTEYARRMANLQPRRECDDELVDELV